MSVAYVDSSCLVAMALGEPSGGAARRELGRHERLFASNLLEAELRAALAREKVKWSAALVAPIGWMLPDRPLGPEMQRALAVGYLRGADLWHVACALYLSAELAPPVFVTLDARQREVVTALGVDAPQL